MPRHTSPVWAILLLLSLTALSCGSTVPEQAVAGGNIDNVKHGANSSRLLSSFDTVCAEDIALLGKTLYLADGPGGVIIFNVKDPSNPVMVGSIATQYAIRVYVNAGYLYVCDGPAGFHVYSLGDPFYPTFTGTFPAQWACGMAFSNGYLYLGDYYDGVKIYNLKDPGRPTLTTYNKIARARDVAVDGSTLVVADSAFGLVTYRLPSPSTPMWTYVDASRFGNFEDIVGYKGYAYLARNDDVSNISVFRTSDTANIELVDEIHPTRFIDGLTRCGDVLLAACGEDGVLAFDLSNLTTPPLLWVIDTVGYARRAKARGTLLYVADMDGLGIYDLANLGGNWNEN